jgi:hypothetical protein
VTVMTEHHPEAVHADADNYAGPRCQGCGGPCWFWKGSVWDYTCTACIDRYLDEGLARWEARERREQEKQRAKTTRNLMRTNDHRTSVTADRRQEGGGSELCAAPPPGVDQTETGGGSELCAAPLDDHQEGLT